MSFSAKVEIPVFNGRGNFHLWQQRMLDMLILHNYDDAKPSGLMILQKENGEIWIRELTA